MLPKPKKLTFNPFIIDDREGDVEPFPPLPDPDEVDEEETEEPKA